VCFIGGFILLMRRREVRSAAEGHA
jgi:hypothetical protein